MQTVHSLPSKKKNLFSNQSLSLDLKVSLQFLKAFKLSF